jgi:phosphohistidine phosphatase SixA
MKIYFSAARGPTSFLFALLLSAFAPPHCALGQPPIIFLVRHAERATISERLAPDPGLSKAGRARAQRLAQELKDAKITAIYTTEYWRTRETAAPLAHSLGITPEIVPADDRRQLTAKLKATSGNVLVVGHSNTIPRIIAALGIRERTSIPESDYDNLFLVIRRAPPELIHLHYRQARQSAGEGDFEFCLGRELEKCARSVNEVWAPGQKSASADMLGRREAPLPSESPK